jgi:hypothetical protein
MLYNQELAITAAQSPVSLAVLERILIIARFPGTHDEMKFFDRTLSNDEALLTVEGATGMTAGLVMMLNPKKANVRATVDRPQINVTAPRARVSSMHAASCA